MCDEYPNLQAIINGRVSGKLQEWPAVRRELNDLLDSKNAEIARLKAAISWVLGEGGSDFGVNMPDNAPAFWWRKELRKRAESA
jgi:hypothetical protein